MCLESIFRVAALDIFPSLMSSSSLMLPNCSPPPIVYSWHAGMVSLAAAAWGPSSSFLADSLSEGGPLSASTQAPGAGA